MRYEYTTLPWCPTPPFPFPTYGRAPGFSRRYPRLPNYRPVVERLVVRNSRAALFLALSEPAPRLWASRRRPSSETVCWGPWRSSTLSSAMSYTLASARALPMHLGQILGAIGRVVVTRVSAGSNPVPDRKKCLRSRCVASNCGMAREQ